MEACRSAKRTARVFETRGRGEIIIMQMPCCGEEESKQQMSGTAPPGKSIPNTVLFVLFQASVIEYKVGSEMKHGPGTSCISSHGFQRHTAEEVAEFFHSLAADRCHRLRIATAGTPVFLFMKFDEREMLGIVPSKVSFPLVAAAKSKSFFGSN